jgi:tetratricopeptide (TPR) repeat protein
MKLLVLLLAAALAGCATTDIMPFPDAAPETQPEPVPPLVTPAPDAPRENVAVARLMENARADTRAGRLAEAGASLERALRIEPRNPRLWHELARVRLAQGQFAQAENLAARSNSFVGSDSTLRSQNEQLIAEARAAGR